MLGQNSGLSQGNPSADSGSPSLLPLFFYSFSKSALNLAADIPILLCCQPTPRDGEDLPDPVPTPDILRQAELFEAAGRGFGREESYQLALSIKRLATAQVSFVGFEDRLNAYSLGAEGREQEKIGSEIGF